MKGIKLFNRAIADFQRSAQQLDTAVKHIEQHRQDNDRQLAREHGIVAKLLESADRWYKRTIDNLVARRDAAKRKHSATDNVLVAHKQSAERIRDRFKELLA